MGRVQLGPGLAGLGLGLGRRCIGLGRGRGSSMGLRRRSRAVLEFSIGGIDRYGITSELV